MRNILTIFIMILLFAVQVPFGAALGEGGNEPGQDAKRVEKKAGTTIKPGVRDIGRDVEKVGEKTAEGAQKTKKTVIDWLWEAWVRSTSALKNMGRNLWTSLERH